MEIFIFLGFLKTEVVEKQKHTVGILVVSAKVSGNFFCIAKITCINVYIRSTLLKTNSE